MATQSDPPRRVFPVLLGARQATVLEAPRFLHVTWPSRVLTCSDDMGLAVTGA